MLTIEDTEHYGALGTAIEMVAAQLKEPEGSLATLMLPFVLADSSTEQRDERLGLVCQYLTKIGAQLAGIIDAAVPGTFDRWLADMRAMANP